MNSNIFCSYYITSLLLEQFSLVIKYRKTEVFHFSRSQEVFNPLSLDFFIIRGFILCSKETWHYLGFIFEIKLSFCQHVDFYANKAVSTVKNMKILENLLKSLIPSQKHLLYRAYILPIMLYSFLLWFYNKASLAYLLKVIRNMQQRAALWILRAFCTSPSSDIETITGLILIHLYLQKLGGRLQLHTQLLLLNHIIKLLLESGHSSNYDHHHLSIEKLTSK